MILAIYKNESKAQPEIIHVHKYSNGLLHVEAIGHSYAHEVGGVYNNLEEVEKYLKQRDTVFEYTRIV